MKRIVCLYLYQFLLLLSNYFDNRYLKHYKVILGTWLLLFTSACQNQKKDNTEDRLCYAPLPMTEDTVEIRDNQRAACRSASEDTTDIGNEPDIICYVSTLEEEDTFVAPKPLIPVVEPEAVPYITCYEPSCYIVEPDVAPTCYSVVVDIDPNVVDTAVYVIVEEMPEFPGGADSLMRYIERNVKYPSGEVCVSGRVVVSFIVEKDGSIGEPKVVRSVEVLLDKEALEVVRNMPKWKPGKQNGKEVRVKYTMPIRFK